MGLFLQKIKDFFAGGVAKWVNASKTFRIISIVVVSCVAAGLIAFGSWYWFVPTEILGMDASHYQGTISWKAVKNSSQIKFVYLKATEGRTYTDAGFKQNWKGAAAADLKVGAYHFFSASSTGTEQANHFIANVPKEKGMLPPAIDIEANITQESDFKQQVADYVKIVQAHYGQKPVFYVPPRIFNLLYDQYSDYPFWVINIKTKPNVAGWTFWQYTYSGTVAGVNGKVDFDKYQGSRFSFYQLLS